MNNGASGRPEFKLEITETLPTTDQLQTILDYVGPDRTSTIVKGAADAKEALRRFKENGENFQRPVVSLSSFSFLVVSWLTQSVCAYRRSSTGTMARPPPARTSPRFSRWSTHCRNSRLGLYFSFSSSHLSVRLIDPFGLAPVLSLTNQLRCCPSLPRLPASLPCCPLKEHLVSFIPITRLPNAKPHFVPGHITNL